MTELDHWQNRLRIGAISRREFVGRAAILGASGALIATMTGATNAEGAETIKKGGVLRLALAGGAVSDRFEPGGYADSVMTVAGRGLFNTLIELAADGATKPELATNWETKDGAKTWMIALRKGVRFSNGREFSADDAIYSLNMHRGETQSRAARLMSAVSDIKKLDRYQIQISLAEADADFPFVLTDHRLAIMPDGFKDWSKPIGTGGYLLDKFDPGVRITFKRAPDYWRAGEGRGNFDAAEISVLAESSERLGALVGGQADVINRVGPKAVALLQKTPKIETVAAPSAWFAVMAMEIDMAPFDNPDFRLALKYAADRDQIVKTSFSGYGAIGNDHPIPPGDPYFNKDLALRTHDLDRAAFHLKKSGVVDSQIVLQASDAAFDGAVDMGALLQASLAKAGVKMQLRNEPTDGFWDNVWLKAPFVESCWSGAPAATHILARVFGADSPLNETHWRNDKFERLLADAKRETDEAKRKTYIWEMQAMLHNDGGAIIPAFKDWIDAHRDNVGGHTPHGGFELDNGYILDKAFLKA
ncbi:MAG TPA: ABC transporter substrate-binding protein [Roseiarcus sp.]|nr:ABC transporter substrate-binding protein [Roseiarcus sp.]